MATRIKAVVAGMVAAASLGLPVTGARPAGAAGIVTHAWMALDAVEAVGDPELRALLEANLDQVRAGAEFPDGGYWTRTLGTPGGDYGEEAHWQRFHDAYAAQIRDDPSCGDLTDPAGPCAPTIAHLMGAAGHGMGDEVWDWLFEPNGPGFGEQYLPADFTPFVGPGGLELQMDLVAIMRHGRPTGSTPELPDPETVIAAFEAVGRGDISIDALPVGDSMLDVERSAETYWAPGHIDALERAMPWTSAHVTSTAGGVAFAARAIAGYYETLWAKILGGSPPTRITATAPFDGQRNVPATGWAGSYGAGSNPGNAGASTRVFAALSSALPYNSQAGGGPVPSGLPPGAMQIRDLTTGALVPVMPGFPRVAPYGGEAGAHGIAVQPAGDLAPCRWYRVEVSGAMLDAGGRPVVPARWRFRTSGCERPAGRTPVRGTTVCEAAGLYAFEPALAPGAEPAAGEVVASLAACAGGQDGTPRRGAHLPVAAGSARLSVTLAGNGCSELDEPSGPATVAGVVDWVDGSGRSIGRSRVAVQPIDLRGGVVRVRPDSKMFGGASLALRIAPDVSGGCGSDPDATVVPFSGGTVTAWPPVRAWRY